MQQVLSRGPGQPNTWVPPPSQQNPDRQGQACEHCCLHRAQGFQPVALALRKDVPAFEERTRSATGGRVTHTLDMARHLSFGVHPTAFVLALPRPEPIAAAEAGSLPQVRRMLGVILWAMQALPVMCTEADALLFLGYP